MYKLYLLVVFTISLLFTGCTPNVDIPSSLKNNQKPMHVRNVELDDLIYNMNKLLDIYRVEPIKVYVEPHFTSNNSNLNKLITDGMMIPIGKLEKISYRSLLSHGRFTENALINDAVGAISESLSNDSYRLKGTLFKDESISSLTSSYQASLLTKSPDSIDGDTGADSYINSTLFTLHSHIEGNALGHLKDTSTTISIEIKELKRGESYGLRFFNESFSFGGIFTNSSSKSQKQLIDQALTKLSQLNFLITIAKFYNVPYWKVIPNAPVNSFAVKKFKENLKSLTAMSITMYLQKQLKAFSYNIEIDGLLGENTTNALNDMQEKYSLDYQKVKFGEKIDLYKIAFAFKYKLPLEDKLLEKNIKKQQYLDLLFTVKHFLPVYDSNSNFIIIEPNIKLEVIKQSDTFAICNILDLNGSYIATGRVYLNHINNKKIIRIKGKRYNKVKGVFI